MPKIGRSLRVSEIWGDTPRTCELVDVPETAVEPFRAVERAVDRDARQHAVDIRAVAARVVRGRRDVGIEGLVGLQTQVVDLCAGAEVVRQCLAGTAVGVEAAACPTHALVEPSLLVSVVAF